MLRAGETGEQDDRPDPDRAPRVPAARSCDRLGVEPHPAPLVRLGRARTSYVCFAVTLRHMLTMYGVYGYVVRCQPNEPTPASRRRQVPRPRWTVDERDRSTAPRSTAEGTETSDQPRRTPLTRERDHRSSAPRDGRRRARSCDDATHRARARRRGDVALRHDTTSTDKDDILDGICERVMSEFEFPEPGRDWADDARRRAARSWRRLLKAHPDVMRLFAERARPVRSVESRCGRWSSRSADPARSGCPTATPAQAFHAFGGYIQGS